MHSFFAGAFGTYTLVFLFVLFNTNFDHLFFNSPQCYSVRPPAAVITWCRSPALPDPSHMFVLGALFWGFFWSRFYLIVHSCIHSFSTHLKVVSVAAAFPEPATQTPQCFLSLFMFLFDNSWISFLYLKLVLYHHQLWFHMMHVQAFPKAIQHIHRSTKRSCHTWSRCWLANSNSPQNSSVQSPAVVPWCTPQLFPSHPARTP